MKNFRYALVVLMAVAVWPIRTPAAVEEPLRVAADRPADIIHIKLELKVDIPKKRTVGQATIHVVALRDLHSIRFDAVDFDVTKVTFARGDGGPSPIDYVNDGQSIEIFFPADNPLTQGSHGTVIIHYSMNDPKDGLHFFGPSQAEPKVPYVVWSQGESITNRYWVPCFDHPNEMQTTEMIVTVAQGNEAISNGRLLSKKKNTDGTVTFHWLQDIPHVSYLITLVVGPFHVERDTWRGKPVIYYVPPDHRDDVKRSFGHTVAMLEYFSNLTGVEYAWDKYAQVCVEGFGGGMENTSATTLGTRTLHDARAHLDFSSDGLVAHELAHQWFGDFVTCKDWAHIWLNEGFASFMDPMWTEHNLGQDEYDYQIYRAMKRAISGGKERPVVDRHYEHPRDMFDSRAYPKGASILHMLRRRLGDKMFWQSVKEYLTTNAHHPVETSDFRKALERVTGRSLERFFYDWTQRPGAPSLDIRYRWSEKDKLASVTVKQTQKEEAFHFPLEVEFHFGDGQPITVRREMVEKEKHFLFPLATHPTMVLIDPHDAVLKEMTEQKGRDLWEAQLTGAPYVTSRIRAAKHFGESGGNHDVDVLAKALLKEKFWGVASEIAESLGDAGGDKARDALLAGLQLEHPKTRRACVEQLASFYKDETVISALYSLIQKGDPSYRVEAEAIRSYGKVQPDSDMTFLASLLARDSHRQQIRSAALSAMGRRTDAAGLDVLLKWTRPGKPRFCRMAAVRAMGTLAQHVHLSDEDLSRIVDTIAGHIEGEQRWVQNASIDTLRGLGGAAKPALAVLRAIESNDPERRIRKAAKKAIEKITAAQPAQVQLGELREELDKLRDKNKELADRLEKLEARSQGGLTED